MLTESAANTFKERQHRNKQYRHCSEDCQIPFLTKNIERKKISWTEAWPMFLTFR